MPEANVDLIGQGAAEGDVAHKILSQGRLDPNQMRPWVGKDGRTYVTAYVSGDPTKATSYKAIPTTYTGTLRRDEWKQLDDVVLQISRERLGGVQDLIDKGLTYNIGNAMGTTVLEYHDISDAMEADLTMDGITRGQGDRPVYGTNYLPLPIIHVDFEINARVLEVSRRNGNPMDTTSVELATRKVAEKLEAMLFTDATYTFGSGTIYSYLNQGNRNLVSLAKHWDASGTTGAEILQDVINMKKASIADHHFGPWMIYVPMAYEAKLEEDYTSTYPKSIRARLMEIQGIAGIKVVDTLPTDNVLMVQMTSDVVRLVRGMGIQVVEWSNEGKMVTKYKVMTIQVPQIRNDQAGHSGLIHLA